MDPHKNGTSVITWEVWVVSSTTPGVRRRRVYSMFPVSESLPSTGGRSNLATHDNLNRRRISGIIDWGPCRIMQLLSKHRVGEYHAWVCTRIRL